MALTGLVCFSQPAVGTADPEGRLFIFDPTSGEVVFETVPVPGDGHVAGLTIDSDGNIWGMTRNAVFRFDPQQQEVTALERYTDRDDSGSYFVGRNIEWAGDRLVVVANDTLFEVDPQTLERTILLEEPGLNMLSVDDEGHRYYYAREGELFEWTRDPVCEETITGSHRGPIQVDAGVTCITDADVRGPVTVTDGASLVLNDSQLRGPLRSHGATQVQLTNNDIAGPVQISSSTGEVSINGNSINGSLSCSGNDSQPVGEDNAVRGLADGQCAELVG